VRSKVHLPEVGKSAPEKELKKGVVGEKSYDHKTIKGREDFASLIGIIFLPDLFLGR